MVEKLSMYRVVFMTNLNSTNLNLLRSLLDVVLKHTMMLIGLGGFYFEIEELAIAFKIFVQK